MHAYTVLYFLVFSFNLQQIYTFKGAAKRGDKNENFLNCSILKNKLATSLKMESKVFLLVFYLLLTPQKTQINILSVEYLLKGYYMKVLLTGKMSNPAI